MTTENIRIKLNFFGRLTAIINQLVEEIECDHYGRLGNNQKPNKTAPAELFEKESLSLLALPENRYTGVKEEARKTSFDCLIAFSGSRYSVTWMFAGKLEWIKISEGYYLQVYSQANKLIASNKLSLKKKTALILFKKSTIGQVKPLQEASKPLNRSS